MPTPTATTIDRSGPAIRATLAEHAPAERAQFEREFHAALDDAGDTFDASPVDTLIGRWWARAIALLNPDPAADAAWQRIQAGDFSDVSAEWRGQPDGSQHVYRPDGAGGWAFSHGLSPQG